MTYFKPFVDDSGLQIPAYDDILQKRISDFQSIYGQDAYLDIDSADYQEIAVQSLALYDAFQSLQLFWNQLSPSTAIGAGLSAIVKFNGVQRRIASYSTCDVVLTGNSAANILNGIVQDKNGVQWALPPSVTLVSSSPPEVYTATVTATCTVLGAVTALAGDLSKIMTPVSGWTSVTNLNAASPGIAIDSDTQLRERQAVSVALPSLSRKEGTAARIAALSGVTRSKVYENPTGSADSNGLPAHSIACVVEGGVSADIAEAIRANKSDGCATYGTTPITTYDSQGIANIINFYRPTNVPIYCTLYITSLTGYTTAITAAIQQAIFNYLNSLQIGEGVTISAIYGVALSVMPTLNEPLFSITSLTAAIVASPQGTTDITLTFAQVAQGILTDIVLVVAP